MYSLDLARSETSEEQPRIPYKTVLADFLPVFFADFLTSSMALRAFFIGTGTRDLIWLKVVSLDRSWLVGLTDDH